MTTTIIHSLQEFHNHYGMYIVAKRLDILFLFFFLFYRTCLFKKEIIRGYLKEIFQSFPLFFYNSWKRKETLAFKTTSFKQGEKINERHKGLLILLQISDSATRDPIQRNIILRLFL